MGAAALTEIAREGILTFFKVGMPVMLVGLFVGFVVSLLQALTQIQEQTLVYVPKVIATFGALLLLLPFMGDALAVYMARLASRIVSGS